MVVVDGLDAVGVEYDEQLAVGVGCDVCDVAISIAVLIAQPANLMI